MMNDEIRLAEAKGRPMLRWVGKKPLGFVKSFPSQVVEVFDPSGKNNVNVNAEYDRSNERWTNLLFHGDNKEVLANLISNGFRGKVDLVYIDPPFDSGADYIRKVELRGLGKRLEGEDYALSEQIQYSDIWANDTYLQFMYDRLILIKELMSDESSIFLHTDWHRGHHLRCLMDEVFGENNFRNEIVTQRGRKKNLQKQFERITSLGGRD